jgi:cytidylate kinase
VRDGSDRPAHGAGAGLVVAVDGPGGAGKSTVARKLAVRLGLRYLDTGAMYRALTWLALDRRIDVEDGEALGELADRAVLTVGTDPRRPTVAVDGRSATRAIRTRVVTNAVSAVAAVPAVRARLVAQQRALIDDAVRAAGGGVVVEGRDIGSVVAPDAAVKVFLTASTDARAKRRARQIGENGKDDVARTRAELTRRDELDSGRSSSPLIRPADALLVDSTHLTADAVVELVLDHYRERLGDVKPPDEAGPRSVAG